MVSRSLVLNKILQKHNGNRSKNMKKDTQIQNIKDYLRPEVEEFIKTKEQKRQRKGKLNRGFWCGAVSIE